MFCDSNFNQEISKWYVSNVKDMEGMFRFAMSFNQPLNNWNVSNVTNMGMIFLGAYSFNQHLNNWDVSNVKNTENMFRKTRMSVLPEWYLHNDSYGDYVLYKI